MQWWNIATQRNGGRTVANVNVVDVVEAYKALANSWVASPDDEYISITIHEVQGGPKSDTLLVFWVSSLVRCIVFAISVYWRIIFIKWR